VRSRLMEWFANARHMQRQAPGMRTQHIGAADELLMRYQLLKIGIDSSRMTIYAGLDLVVQAAGDRTVR
jgi:hypothetical protein